MNTLKILSLSIFALICFYISLRIAIHFMNVKKIENNSYNKMITLSSVIISVAIANSLVLKKVSYLYDIFSEYSYDLKVVFRINNFDYGYSPEMTTISCIYLILAFGWVSISIWLARLMVRNYFKKETLAYYVFEAVVLLSFNVAFYPLLDFILENFYVVLNRPLIN